MLGSLLARGYFTEELPPPFTTNAFAAAVEGNPAALPNEFLFDHQPKTRPVIHSVVRPGNLPRRFSLPNPSAAAVTARLVCENWELIETLHRQSHFSMSRPVASDDPARRALIWAHTRQQQALRRVEGRVASRYIVRADLSLFYPSIYTHSFPWVLQGKEFSKLRLNRNDMTLAANQIDRALRRGQDDQTIGIPIGPSWSLALSELITSQIDERLQNEFPNARGVRLLDDYEIGAESEAEAERILAFLRSALADYELQLNTSKTSVTPAPLPLVPSWISDLRAFRIRGSERTQSDDILRYFDLAASLGESTATATPMTWFARRLRWMSIRGRNWPLVHDLLLQAMVIEPGSIRHAMGALLHHSRSGFPVDREGLQRTLTRLIVRHAPQGSGSEVAWSLWSAIAFDVALGEEVGQAVSGLPDAVVALLAMDAANRGLLLGLDTTAWLALLTTEELRAEHWLLAYEAPLKGWLGDRTHFAGAPEFEWLSSQAVSFYDSDEPLRRSNEMTAPKPPDKGEQGKSSEQIQPTPFVLDLFDIPVTIESGDNGDEEPYP